MFTNNPAKLGFTFEKPPYDRRDGSKSSRRLIPETELKLSTVMGTVMGMLGHEDTDPPYVLGASRPIAECTGNTSASIKNASKRLRMLWLYFMQIIALVFVQKSFLLPTPLAIEDGLRM
jgi:hypothetical protein